MSNRMRILRRVFGTGLVWALLWGACWAIVGVVIGIVDPGSIGPDEGPMVVASVLGPMGLLSGVAFGLLLSTASGGRACSDHSLPRVAGLGILGSAIVQLAYLDHGDQGLAANVGDAVIFCAMGGLVTMAWLMLERRWPRWRSSLRASTDPER